MILAKIFDSNILYILSFILSSWLLLIYFENRFFNIWFVKYKSSKLFFSLISFVILLYLSVDSASQINNIFGVDSGVFIYTQSFVIVMSFLLYISGTILVVGLFSQLLFLYELFLPSEKSPIEFKKRGIYVINGVIILFSFFSFAYPYLEQKERNKLIVKISEKVDFGKHLCSNIDSDKRIVYLNPSHTKILLKTELDNYIISNCIN